jgi:sugar lactone lactonase YvrE
MLRFTNNWRITGVLVAVLMASLPIAARAAAPSFLPSFPMRAGNVAIMMWAPVIGATEYKVLKKVDSGAFQEIYRGPMNNFSDPNAPADKTLTYKVVPVIGGKDGDASTEAVLAGIKPLEPPTISGILADPGGLRVRWTVVQGASFYNLYRSESKEGPFSLITSIQEPQYFDRDPKPGKPFFYQVSAIDKMNTESPKSAVANGQVETVVKVDVFKPVYREIKMLGEFRGQTNNELVNPVAFFVTKKGEWAVVDENGIQFLDKDGAYVHRAYFDSAWGNPHAAYMDAQENLYVTFANNKIHKVGLDGKDIVAFTVNPPELIPTQEVKLGPITMDGGGNLWVGEYNSSQVIILEPKEGKELGRVGYLRGLPPEKAKALVREGGVDIAVPGRIMFNAKKNEIWVGDSMNAVIDIFDVSKRAFVKSVGGRAGKEGVAFEGISGLMIRENGNALVLDSMSAVIKEFDPTMKYVATYLDPVTKERKKLNVDYASGLSLDQKGNLIIMSTMLGKVHRYPPLAP